MTFQLFPPGKVIDGKYEVVNSLGRGGCGTVLHVRHLSDGADLALKYCTGVGEDAERFRREVNLLEDLHLPGVISVVEVELNSSPPYYVMVLAEGSLEDHANRFRSGQPAILNAFRQICTGVTNIHNNGIFHRDLKPSNVLVVDGRLVVADFGLARPEVRTTAGQTEGSIGTIDYMAPEMKTADGAKNADARSDIFSLGKLLYWLHTGLDPLHHFDVDKLPHGIAEIVLRATAADKAKRHSSVDDLVHALDLYESLINQGSPNGPNARNESVNSSHIDTLEDLAESAKEAILAPRPDAKARVRRFMERLVQETRAISPVGDENDDDDKVVGAIARTEAFFPMFSTVAEAVADMDQFESAAALYKGFESILYQYYLPTGFSGSYSYSWFDFWKFAGHELFICLIAPLVREERWALIGALLERPLLWRNSPGSGNQPVSFGHLSRNVDVLERRNVRLNLGRVSLHADLLNDRHTTGLLAVSCPIEAFIEADVFLQLRSMVLNDPNNRYQEWYPWSSLYQKGIPSFLQSSVSARLLAEMYPALGSVDVALIRSAVGRAKEQARSLYRGARYFEPLEDFDPQAIGSR